ncbi:hypothetical protein ABZ319_34780 [Nocardia sp. NPDC005978]|uniref:DUF7373 family lipoprotein n=1 Tax=Nocardia sp. NPDC005978 TaxID=3156725 RepID=UPI0033A5C89D
MPRTSRRTFPPLSRYLLAVALAGLTACGVAGHPVPAELDVRTLDTGAYPVDRYRYDQDARDNGSLLEGMRMSGAVPIGPAIDATLTSGRGGRVVLDAADAESGFLASDSAAVLERQELITGYAAGSADAADPAGSERPAATTTSVTVLLLRFPSAAAAKLAARELEDVDFAVAADQNRRLNLTAFPDAFIHWRPGVANVGTFMAHGDFVISLLVQRPRADGADLTEWVRKTLDAQVRLLDSFAPTPAEDIAELKVDPDNLLARVVTAHRGSRTPDPDSFAVYSPVAFLHNSADQSRTERLFTDTGADRLAIVDDGSLVRARDGGAAINLLTGLTGVIGAAFVPAAAPEELPGASCFHRTTDDLYRCYVAYKRYVAIVNSDSHEDARQKVSAQYALIANAL